MSADANPISAERRLRGLALASAATIGLAYAIAWKAAPDEIRAPSWHPLLMMAPHLTIAALASRVSHPSSFVWGLARGVATATRTGIVVLLLMVPAQILLLIFPYFMVQIGAVTWVPAVQMMMALLGLQATLLILTALFVLQFPLAQVARGASAGVATDAHVFGRMAGLASLVLPIAIVLNTQSREAAASRRAAALSDARSEERERPVRLAAEEHERVAERTMRAILTRLPACVRTGCVDSLIASGNSEGVTLQYVRKPRSQYWGLVTSDVRRGRRYVTDETGIRLQWMPDQFRQESDRPDSLATLAQSDSSVANLVKIADCLDQYYVNIGGPPQHIDSWRCGLKRDTTLMRVDGSDYRVTYLPQAPDRYDRINEFSFDVRPVRYGESAVRNFLMVSRGSAHAVYVTTADRAAARSDPTVHACEQTPSPCRVPVPRRRRDSSVATLIAMSECIDMHFGSAHRRLEHISDPVCGLARDTTLLRLDRADYRVVYLHDAREPYNSKIRFSLSARPVRYGEPAVRSFLVLGHSPVYATTANRGATRSDPTAAP